MTIRNFYLIAALIGTILPWLLFGSFFAANGLNIPLFLKSLYANGAAGGFSTDVMLSILVFWIWSFRDARKNSIPNWWLVIPAGSTVGLSLALPLYLYFREGRT